MTGVQTCALPISVGAHAVPDGPGRLTLHAVLAAAETGPVLRRTASGDDPTALGASVAAALLAEVRAG